MDINQLRQFVVVADELNFTRAARRLRIAQPSLSQAIARLEREMGGRLFERDRQHVELTLAGHTFLTHAVEVLTSIDKTKAATRAILEGVEGTLDIGCVSSMLAGPMGEILKRFGELAPDIVVNMFEMHTMQQVEALARGRIDLGILRSGVKRPILATHRLYQESLVVALSDDHSLAKASSISMPELADDSFVLMGKPSGAWYTQSLVEVCGRAGFTPHIIHECDHILTELALVSAGKGIAVVPESAKTLRVPGVVYKSIASPSTWTSIEAAWKEGSDANVVATFIKAATEIFGVIRSSPKPAPQQH